MPIIKTKIKNLLESEENLLKNLMFHTFKDLRHYFHKYLPQISLYSSQNNCFYKSLQLRNFVYKSYFFIKFKNSKKKSMLYDLPKLLNNISK